MTRRALVSKYATFRSVPVAAAVIAIAIFILDTLPPPNITLSVLYVAVWQMVSSFCKPREVWLAFLGCVGLTVLSYVLAPPAMTQFVGLSNTALAIMAMGLTAFLAAHYQSAERAVREQATLLDLTHDCIIAGDMNNVITYWNRGAEALYGWTAAEVIG